MRSSVGQFVFWFFISFSPAPLVGFGTYAIVHGQDAAPQAVAPAPTPSFAAPLDRDLGVPEQPAWVEETPPVEVAPAEPGSAGESEGGTGHGRRKQAQPEPQKRKPDREAPDL